MSMSLLTIYQIIPSDDDDDDDVSDNNDMWLTNWHDVLFK